MHEIFPPLWFHFRFFLLCACAGAKGPVQVAPSAAPENPGAPEIKKTVIHNQAEAKQLLGKHLFSNEAYSGYFGEAVVFGKDGVYQIHGMHHSYREQKIYGPRHYDLFAGSHLKIDGVIEEISDLTFVFTGDIETSFLYKEAFYPCLRQGTFLFSRKKHYAYWRLQSASIPEHCKNDPDLREIEYIDLFSKHEL